MANLAPALPQIRPITDLRTKYNEVCALATESQAPVILTKNGVASYVLQDSNAYDREQRRLRTHLALREAEIEERYRPDAISAEESDERMKCIFAQWGIDYA